MTHRLHVVFDLDGTLVDTAPDLLRTLNHVLAGAGCPPVAMERIRPLIAFGARRMLSEGLRAAGRSAGAADIEPLLGLFLDHYGANIAVESRPFPGALEALERLAAAGARMAVCTNKLQDLSHRLLRELDLDRYFTAIVGRDTLDVCKPHPGHLTGTLKRLGGGPARAVMIGDSGVDIATAKAAGVPVIAVTFGYSEAPIASYGPDRLIDRFDELEAALAGLLGAAAGPP